MSVSGPTPTSSINVQGPGVSRSDLQNLARSRASVGHAILVKISVEASMSREWVLNVGRRDSRSRMAHLLCKFAVRLQEEGLAVEFGYELPMTQEQLADALGLTPVHVDRTLKTVEIEGLITRTKRTVSFPDWRQMRRPGTSTSATSTWSHSSRGIRLARR